MENVRHLIICRTSPRIQRFLAIESDRRTKTTPRVLVGRVPERHSGFRPTVQAYIIEIPVILFSRVSHTSSVHACFNTADQ